MRAPRLLASLLVLPLVAACIPTDDEDPEPTPEPTVCGGFIGATCDAGEFCLFEESAICGWADATGTCEATPDACYLLYAPVCGCDGNTYSNDCVAHASGTSVLHEITPAAADDVVGDWSGTAPGGWVTQWQLREDGTFTKTDLIAPCPEGVACFWSGIVTNQGTWTMGLGGHVALTFQSPSNMAGATTPASLSAAGDCDGYALHEAGPDGGSAVYTLD